MERARRPTGITVGRMHTFLNISFLSMTWTKMVTYYLQQQQKHFCQIRVLFSSFQRHTRRMYLWQKESHSALLQPRNAEWLLSWFFGGTTHTCTYTVSSTQTHTPPQASAVPGVQGVCMYMCMCGVVDVCCWVRLVCSRIGGGRRNGKVK